MMEHSEYNVPLLATFKFTQTLRLLLIRCLGYIRRDY